jgi:hypothetical protein
MMNKPLMCLLVIAVGVPALTLLAWLAGLADTVPALAGGAQHPLELVGAFACVGLRITSLTVAPIAGIAALLVWTSQALVHRRAQVVEARGAVIVDADAAPPRVPNT